MQHFTSTPGAPPPSASSLQPDGELRGWLHKQATSGKWQRRYFALREGTLEYYRRPEEPKPSGAAWKSNFGRPTPWTRRCLRSCVCSMAWSFQATDATLSPVTPPARWRGGVSPNSLVDFHTGPARWTSRGAAPSRGPSRTGRSPFGSRHASGPTTSRPPRATRCPSGCCACSTTVRGASLARWPR